MNAAELVSLASAVQQNMNPATGHVLRMKLRSARQRFTVSAKRRVGSAYRRLPQFHQFSAAWGRLFLVYGPGDPAQRLIPMVLANFREKKLIPMTHGAQLRDFVYAPDAADLLVRLLLSEAIGAYNVGTGNASTVRSVVSYLAERTHNSGLLQFGALEASEVDAAFLVANMAKVSERLQMDCPDRHLERS